ncbi:MAG: dihydroorotate dehydrogenase electron transfer subunit [Bacteroidia bacterium]|nr:dihydroorotate dehydrogenase electron transfer subunit [Bacteroidia bacterium]
MFRKRVPIPTANERIDIPVMTEIIEVVQETNYVKTFTLDISLNAQPGQFVNIWLPEVDEKPFSVAEDDGKTLKITFFAVGEFTKKLFECKKGDKIGIRGPYGRSYVVKPNSTLALVAGGYGAAPMYFLAQKAVEKKCIIHFIVGAKQKEHLLYLDSIRKLPNTYLYIATNDGSMGYKGYNTEVLEQLLSTYTIHQVFACGPEMMLYRIFEICQAHNIEGQLSIERYMKCGFGVCGQCVLDPTGDRVCVEGSVMNTEQLRYIEEFGKYHRDKEGMKQFFK